MDSADLHKYIRLYTVFAVVMTLYLAIVCRIDEYNHNKGEAIASYLDTYQGISIPPDQAQYFNINVNQWDISIQDLDVFASWQN